MIKLYLVFILCTILSIESAFPQKLEWPIRVRASIAAILIQGDTSVYLAPTNISGNRYLKFNFNFDRYRLMGATMYETMKDRMKLFLNAYLFPETKRYPINGFALSLDSFRNVPMDYDVVQRNSMVLLGKSRRDKLKLLLTNLPYDADGNCYGKDSIFVSIHFDKPLKDALDGNYYNMLVFSIYNFVADEKLKRLTIKFESGKEYLGKNLIIDNNFRKHYKRYIANWTYNVSHNAKIK